MGYLLLALAWTWPLPAHAATRFAHDAGDPLLNIYLLWWNAHVVPLSSAMWSAPFYWPMHDALALTEHGAGMALVTSPIQWLGGSPLLAYNLLLIASAWWSALAVHALVRRIARPFHPGSFSVDASVSAGDGSFVQVEAAAWCAGLMWGFAPYRASQLAHLQVLVAWWMPVALLALHAYFEDGRRRWLVLLGAAWLIQALSNGYYLFFFPVLVAGWLAVFTRGAVRRRRAVEVLATLAIFSLPLLPVLWEYYTVQHRLGFGRTRTEMEMFGATWASFGHTSPMLRFWPSFGARSQEDFLFPGVAALVAIAAALITERGRVVTRPFLFYASAAMMFAWMAAGPSPVQWSAASLWHAYDWVAWVPGYAGLRVPSRFFMLSSLCLDIAGGMAVAALGRTRRRVLAIAAGISVLALADGWIVAMPLGVPPHPFGVPLVAGARVLELPVDDEAANVAAMYRGTLHGLPLINGYAGYVPSHAAVIEWALRRRDPSILTELRRGHPLYVAVAPQPSTDAPPDVWSAFMDAQNMAQMVGVSGAGRLYLMPAAPFPPQVTVGAPFEGVRGTASDGWLTYDFGQVRAVRALDLRTRGHFLLLNATVRVETSIDGSAWTLAADEPPGGLALAGALKEPLAVPLRVLLPDPSARFLRINTPAFGPAAVTIYGR